MAVFHHDSPFGKSPLDDGKAYILNNGGPIGRPLYDGHRAIWIQEFDPATRRMVGDRTLIVNGGVDISQRPVWIEGPHIYKRNGWYYLSAAEGGTAVDHSQVILRSRNVRGPYEPGPDNPILTQRHLDPARPFPVTSAGHADFVQTPSGDWWTIFLAVRPYREDYHNIGRETFLLPVRWEGEWPSILSGDAVIPHVAPRRGVPVNGLRIAAAGQHGNSSDIGQLGFLVRTWRVQAILRLRWPDP